MLQAYPAHTPEKEDPEAATDIAWLKAFALAVRNIRGEMNIPPGKRIPVLLRAGSADDPRRIEMLQPELMQLCGVASLDWLKAEAPASATGLCGSLEILVPLADLIDRDAEIKRLDKEIDKLRSDLARIQGKLGNASFLAKAPESVVQKEQEKMNAQQSSLDKLLLQRQQLGNIPA
jgi:valyl-tRNA synthetase